MSLPAAAMGPDSGERKPILIEPCAATPSAKPTESRSASKASRVTMRMAVILAANAVGGRHANAGPLRERLQDGRQRGIIGLERELAAAHRQREVGRVCGARVIHADPT